MTPTTTIDEELKSELEAVAAAAGCELFDVRFTGSQLRVVLDRRDGVVTVDDCVLVSRQLSPLLDVFDFGGGRYTLEVSSPGLDRPLRDAADYVRFAGRLAKLTVLVGESKRTIVARLQSFDPADGGTVTVVERDRNEVLEFPIERIVRARLEIEI